MGMDSPRGLQEAEGPIFSRQLAHEGDEIVSPMHWLPLTPAG